MKSIKKLAVVAVLALSGASLASAQGIVHVTGSTAYRNADVSAECAYVQNTLGETVTAAYWGSSLAGASDSMIFGNGTALFVNHWSGSIGGDQQVVNAESSQAYADPGTYTGPYAAPTNVGTSTAVGGGTAVSSSAPTATVTSHGDIAFSDVSYSTASQIILAATSPATPEDVANIQDIVVGVVPFVWVSNFGAPAGLTNITPQAVTALYGIGRLPLSFFTGNNADESTIVYATGRDVDSGTRGTLLSETGYGLDGSGFITTPLQQYYPYSTSGTHTNTTNVVGLSGNTGPIAGFSLVPKETLDGYKMAVGDGGYNSGGALQTAMNATNSVASTAMVTLLGLSDAKNALTAAQPANLLSYNGVTFNPFAVSPNLSAIYEGQYTVWGYEHEFYSSSNPNTNVTTYAAGVQSQLTGGIDKVSSGGVTSASMRVSRSGDGQNVQATYAY